jgi:hypothetical protein
LTLKGELKNAVNAAYGMSKAMIGLVMKILDNQSEKLYQNQA